MSVLIIGDTHFGIKQNNRGWLQRQLDYLRSIDLGEVDCVVHVGDLFESRHSVDIYVLHEVRQWVYEVANTKPFYIIAGNHDQYGPSTSVWLMEEVFYHPNLHIITRQIAQVDDFTLVPWIVQLEEGISELSKRYEHIITHTDLTDQKIYNKVTTGHIHQPHIRGLYRTIGSCFCLDFSDVGRVGGAYIYDPVKDSYRLLEDNIGSRFYRLYSIDDMVNIRPWDYVELFLDGDNLDHPALPQLIKDYPNLRILPRVIIQDEQTIIDVSKVEDFIPEELLGIFNKVKQVYNDR